MSNFFPSHYSAVVSMPTLAQLNPTEAMGSGGTLPSGYYEEDGYVYEYNAGTGAITIVLSPISSGSTSVQKNSAAYVAIIGHIVSGLAEPITSSGYKKLKAKAAKSSGTSSVPAPATITSLDELPEVPIHKRAWFVPAAIVTVTFVVGGLMIWNLSSRK